MRTLVSEVSRTTEALRASKSPDEDMAIPVIEVRTSGSGRRTVCHTCKIVRLREVFPVAFLLDTDDGYTVVHFPAVWQAHTDMGVCLHVHPHYIGIAGGAHCADDDGPGAGADDS